MPDENDDNNVVQAQHLFEEKYRTRKPDSIDSIKDAVEWCNRYYAKITVNGRFFVLNERIDTKISFMRKQDFLDSLEHRRLVITDNEGKSKIAPIAKLWLESPSARVYEEVIFDPGQIYDRNSSVYNLWRGFITTPRQGDCSKTTTYIHDILASNSDEIYNWIMDFFAHMIQKPWEKPEVALVMMGLKGVGKTFLMHIIKVLIDGKHQQRHCFKTSSQNDIYGDYTEHLKNLIALLLEEVTWGGDIRHESKLKDLISDHSITVNIKFGPTMMINNVMRIIMAANPGWSVPASYDERRYMVVHVSPAQQQNHSYFKAIQDELDSGGYEALMYDLLNRDITSFNCREALVTDALISQKDKSMSTFEKWWLEVLTSGEIRFIEDQFKDDAKWIVVGREILYQSYSSHIRKVYTKQKLLTPTQFGIQLRELLPLVVGGKIVMNEDGRRVESVIEATRLGKERLYCHLIPPLVVCRSLLDFRLGRNRQWDEPTEWQAPEYDDSVKSN
jgi:Family of unknown function (DUF5906)